MQGHLGSVWSIAVSCEGNHLVSCGKDFSLRLWQKSQEILLPDEEREMEREKEDEKLLTKNLEPVVSIQNFPTSINASTIAHNNFRAELFFTHLN